jgi:hypothetical protein
VAGLMTGFAEVQPVANEKGCWYLIEISECPLCGSYQQHRTRQLGPRPKDDAQRYRYQQVWDWCQP